MRIEINEKGSPAFYKEVVNVVSQYRALISNPERKLQDNFKKLRNYLIISVLMLIAMLPIVLRRADTLGIVLIVLLLVVAAFSGLLLFNLNKLLKNYLADRRTSAVTLDENGVEIDKAGSQVVRLVWENIAFVRAFNESVCFISRDIAGLVLAVTIDHKQEILDYLYTANTGVKILS